MRETWIEGQIERRLLVNYRVDPAVITRILPHPFRPQLVRGAAVAGICLIRLGRLRPQHLPGWIGLSSENAAHRIAVEWDTPAGARAGVYIPRRDSNSWANIILGGRLYPGEHHRARFQVHESSRGVQVGYVSRDGTTRVDVSVRVADGLPDSRLFTDLAEASAFFEAGSTGYSATRNPRRFDGLRLRTSAWRVEATTIDYARSTYFDDRRIFPAGAVALDNALLMRQLPVRWETLAPLEHDHLPTDASISSDR